MFKKLFKEYILPTAVLSGGMIGVGFLSLPYIAMKAGILITILYFLILTSVVISVHLIFAKISLKTPDFKRFPGFAEYYLGKWGKLISLFTSVLGFLGVLLVYLIIGGEFLSSALNPIFGGSKNFYTFIYFVFGAIIIFFGIKVISRVELLSVSLLFVSIVLVFIKGFSDIRIGNFLSSPSDLQLSNIFIPYGPILFAMWGVSIIPEVEEMMRPNKKLINKIIIVGTLIPVVIYILFIFLTLSITGDRTTESALTGLSEFLGGNLMTASLLMGAVITFVAFVVQGLTFKKILMYDLRVKNWQALIISCCTPMILYLLGMKSFIFLISFIGAIFLGIDGILILLMYKKIGGKNIVIFPLFVIFLLGIIYEIIYFIN